MISGLSRLFFYFYPRPPRGGRPVRPGLFQRKGQNFYPRPPRGGRRARCKESLERLRISIHALREEGDKAGEPVTIPINDFYPRPPRGGRPFALASHILVTDFYPRPPRGGRPVALPNEPGNRFISIHALREEGDKDTEGQKQQMNIFLSTPSARRATARAGQRQRAKKRFLSTPSARRATCLSCGSKTQ